MKLTKLKALEICAELWKWLVETGNKYKLYWKGWEKYGDMCSYCPCCEYIEQNGLNCNDCPLISLWDGHCNYCQSPFCKWANSKTIKERKKYARIIYQGCLNEIKKYDNNKHKIC